MCNKCAITVALILAKPFVANIQVMVCYLVVVE